MTAIEKPAGLFSMAALAVLAFALLRVLSVAPFDGPLISDNQHYFFIAERAASGVAPHVSQFDPKTSFTMLATAAAIRSGRTLGVNDLHSARALSVAATAGVVTLVFLCARSLGGNAAGLVAALSMLGFSGFIGMGAMGVRPKVFMALFTLGAVLASSRRRPLACGAASALAFLCWQSTALVAVFALVDLLMAPGRLRSFALYCAGFALALLPYELYFLAHDALAQQWEQTIIYPSVYMVHGPGFKLFGRHVAWFLRVQEGFNSASVLPALSVAAAAGAWLWCLARPSRVGGWLSARPGWIALVAGGHAALLFTLYDYQGFPDRFLVEPFMAVGIGLLLGLPVSALARNSRYPAAALLLAVAVAVLLPLAQPGKNVPRGHKLASQYRLSERVHAMQESGQSIYAVGCTHLLAFSHMDNHVPLGLGIRGMTAWMHDRGDLPWKPLRDGRLPNVVLHSRGPMPGGNRWLKNYYRRVADTQFASHKVKVYMLIDQSM
ncbi:MAG TPA: hypothetical protein EYG16_01175 [Deltaproteobacteria bacterium]|nr:hypothetical protein [Candidatus Binatota bacterium]HIL12266.1 hypothetical protein [Deltaproteobacteria bacterium]